MTYVVVDHVGSLRAYGVQQAQNVHVTLQGGHAQTRVSQNHAARAAHAGATQQEIIQEYDTRTE